MANSRWKQIVGIGGVVFLLVIGFIASSLFKTPAAATGPIEAIPLAESTTGSTGAAPATTAPTSVEAVATPVGADTAATTEAVAPEVTSAEATTAAAAPAASSGSVVLQIVQDESEARFQIDEVLNSEPKTVVGTTNQVAGEIAAEPSDPTKSRVGIIQVNARTLSTDSSMRNRTIANRILNTNQYEFITFTPSSIMGLPSSGAVGQSYSFQVTGSLTIREAS